MIRSNSFFALIPLVLVGCQGSAAGPEAKAEEPPPVAVEIATVEKRDVLDTLSVDGNLVLPEGATAKLAPSIAGRVIELTVKEGDRIVAGQLLARLDGSVLDAQRQSAEAGASSANATALQTDLARRAAEADQKSALESARLALEVTLAQNKADLGQAEIELQRLRAGARPQELAQAQQTVDQARIARDKAKLDADRDARLLKEGLVAGSQADASLAALRTAESALRSAQASLDLLSAGTRTEDLRASELRLASVRQLAAKKVDQARAALRQAEMSRLNVAAKAQEESAARLAAQQKLADARAASASAGMTEIRSPIAGYVVKRFVNVGDSADPTTPVLAISAVKPYVDFLGSVSTEEAGRLRTGLRILVGQLGGTVTAVGEADPSTGLVPVRARLAGTARAGGFATAQIVIATLSGVATVPKGAVLSRDGQDVVFAMQDGTAHLTKVDLGPEEKGRIALRQGIKVGQKVVILGGHELSDGTKIEAAKTP